ncbi:MAG TPA: RIO1 family regulatory kinase/ATPase [Anaerolineaceae bacterium]|nr:RIO1 family regulatory kinase/ATPase [Anaerolineaceae bacterium]
MKSTDLIQIVQELDNDERIDDFLKGRERRRPVKHLSARNQHFLQSQDDSKRNLQFTYKAARFEQGWLLNSLGDLYEQRWISDVLRKIKAGKEASVYLCKSGERVEAPLVAAKVYRPRMLRNLRNDGQYREGRIELDEQGREVHDTHALHAVFIRSRFGEQVRHQSWIAYEYTALQALYQAGADVPRPYELAPNAILMEYFGDETMPAPTLNEVDLEPGEAGPLFERLLRNLNLMLACQRVHGDLSAYNVLYWEGDIALIDFPQVVLPASNRNAYAIFERDVTRLCEYFIQQGLSLQPRRLAAELWEAHDDHLGLEMVDESLLGE